MDVSVIIPTYRSADTLSRAINSVLGQESFDSYEIIVIDDNNPNDEYRMRTEAVMAKYSGDSRIIYIKHEKNLNGATARNTGFKHSKGKYICFLDDDDIFLPNKLALQVKYMDSHPEFGASYTWREYCSGGAVKCSKTGNLEKDVLLLDFYPTTITIMIRRECYQAINGFNESFRRHQDLEFILRFFEKYEIGVVEEVLSQIIGKKTHNNCVTGKELLDLKSQFFTAFDATISRIELKEPGFKKRVFANHCAEVFTSNVSSKHYFLAFEILLKGLTSYGIYFIKRIISHYKLAFYRQKGSTIRIA